MSSVRQTSILTGGTILLVSIVFLATVNSFEVTPAGLIKSPKMSTSLQSAKFSTEEPTSIIVSFSQETATVISTFEITSSSMDRPSKLTMLKDQLVKHAESNQKAVITYLKDSSNNYRVLWVTNQIAIANVTVETTNNLAQFEEVSYINEDTRIPLENSAGRFSSKKDATSDEEHEWGIKSIEADKAQTVLKSINNRSPVVVGVIDSGVSGTHEALRETFVGDYGWYDPILFDLTPNDDDGHGTHCAGTILGTKGIGVFPSAQWMACRACWLSGCWVSDFIDCGQFMICPFLPNGTEDCSKAPHVVSNSWGSNFGNDKFYSEVILAYHAVGIIPVFAVGNEGPECSTASSPGDYEYVIAVGATAMNESIADFSSVGPAVGDNNGKYIKPDIVAPGVDIRSAGNKFDDSYEIHSGTSMACPHASGVVAMMLSVNPKLKFEEVRRYLLVGSETEPLVPSGKTCGNIPDTEFPNHIFGHGRLNAFKSVNLVLADKEIAEPVVVVEKKSTVNAVVLAVVCSIAGVIIIASVAAVLFYRKKVAEGSSK